MQTKNNEIATPSQSGAEDYGKQLAARLFSGRKGHGGVPVSYMQLSESDVANIAAVAFEKGAARSADHPAESQLLRGQASSGPGGEDAGRAFYEALHAHDRAAHPDPWPQLAASWKVVYASMAKQFLARAAGAPADAIPPASLPGAAGGLAAAWKVLHDHSIPASNRYVRAIKAHRGACGSSLREAKDAVDGLKSGHIRPPLAPASNHTASTIVVLKTNCAPVVEEIFATEPGVQVIFVDADLEGCDESTTAVVEGAKSWIGRYGAEKDPDRVKALLDEVSKLAGADDSLPPSAAPRPSMRP